MARPRVVITRKWPEVVEDQLEQQFDAVLNEDDRPFTDTELHEAMRTADAICPTVTDKITADILGTNDRRAGIVGNYGVGFNNIDVEAARTNAVVVTNTPGVLTDATADLAMTHKKQNS